MLLGRDYSIWIITKSSMSIVCFVIDEEFSRNFTETMAVRLSCSVHNFREIFFNKMDVIGERDLCNFTEKLFRKDCAHCYKEVIIRIMSCEAKLWVALYLYIKPEYKKIMLKLKVLCVGRYLHTIIFWSVLLVHPRRYYSVWRNINLLLYW